MTLNTLQEVVQNLDGKVQVLQQVRYELYETLKYGFQSVLKQQVAALVVLKQERERQQKGEKLNC